MGIWAWRTGKIITTAKIPKKGKNTGICWDEKAKTKQQTNLIVQLEEINQKIMTKEGRLKRHRDRVKQYNKNRILQNNERKIYQKLGGEYTRTYRQPDAKEANQCWSKIWERKVHNRKAEWMNNMKKKIKGLEEGPQAMIHLKLFRRSVLNWKIPGHDGICGFWF